MSDVQELVLIILYVTLALLSLQLLIIINGDKLIATLLLLQLVSTSLLWSLDPSVQRNDQVFAVYLAGDLLGFSMISYNFRMNKLKGLADRKWMALGCCVMFVLLIVGLLFD